MAAKKLKILIGTHNGTFHCDEVLACWLLKQLPEFSTADILRSRDPARLAECDIVVDVGGVFDPSKGRFDHHQKGFTETLNSLNPTLEYRTKLSSAGLIWAHYGKKVVSTVLNISANDALVLTLYEKMYANFVEEIDAIDNGISQFDGMARYAVTTTLSKRVGNLNPWWNRGQSEDDQNAAFEKAMCMVGGEFSDRLKYFHECWWPARLLVEQALKSRYDVDSSGTILKLGSFPWKEHLFDLEQLSTYVGPKVLFALYEDGTNKDWRIQAVPKDLHGFGDRLSLPEAWRGLRDSDLSNLTGVPGCVFCHAGGFIGGNKSFEGALAMAKLALQQVSASGAMEKNSLDITSTVS